MSTWKSQNILAHLKNLSPKKSDRFVLTQRPDLDAYELSLVRQKKHGKDKVMSVSINRNHLECASAEHIFYDQGKHLFEQMERYDTQGDKKMGDGDLLDSMSYAMGKPVGMPPYKERSEKPLFWRVNEPEYASGEAAYVHEKEPLDSLRWSVAKWLTPN